jgi:uncharacterized SAM-binding protein YcdF (DUF218 family)
MAVRRSLAKLAAGGTAILVVALLLPRAGDALVVTRPVSSPQAIVSLASHEWERLPATAGQAAEYPDAVVLLTQPARPTPENCTSCSDRVGWLVWLGAGGHRIVVLLRPVFNTRDEALAVREYCQQHGIKRLLVVTSPYHTRRTLATFLTMFRGMDTAIGVYPALNESMAQPDHWWRQRYDRAYVRYEWAALAWYALRYGVNPIAPEEAAL